MAIDSAAKRLSAMDVGHVTTVVYPSGTINQAARQDATSLYRGILATAPVIAEGSSTASGPSVGAYVASLILAREDGYAW